MQDGATFNNTGSFVLDSDINTTIQQGGSGPNTFVNAGTFTKQGTGTTTVYPGFDNTDTVEVEAGTFYLSGSFPNFSGTT